MKIITKLIELYSKHLNKQVEKYWQIYHFDMSKEHRSYNNEGDAFKHCYFQAELTLFLGNKIAEWIGDKHEDNNLLNNEKERNMDLHNNEVGRNIAKKIKKNIPFWFLKKWDDIISKHIIGAMQKGLLITKIE